MGELTVPEPDNRLIAALPPMARRRLLAVCEPVDLLAGQALCSMGQPVTHVYFLREGFAVLSVPVLKHNAIQVGMLGREGMLGAHLLWGMPLPPWQAQVQQGGRAWRMGARAFRSLCQTSLPLQQSLALYQCGLLMQLALEAGGQPLRSLETRLARWLCMADELGDHSPLLVTQERLAQWLGVRRVGVTVAEGALSRQGLIACRRGEIRVLNPRGLRALAGMA
jgi:CRP-like cAMP-binding protein